jgi:hypothetical protein
MPPGPISVSQEHRRFYDLARVRTVNASSRQKFRAALLRLPVTLIVDVRHSISEVGHPLDRHNSYADRKQEAESGHDNNHHE